MPFILVGIVQMMVIGKEMRFPSTQEALEAIEAHCLVTNGVFGYTNTFNEPMKNQIQIGSD
jgi:hypothetical protein